MEAIPEELRAEIEQLGWTVEVSSETGVWELRAIRGQQSWLYLSASLEDVCGAALEMARHDKAMGLQTQRVTGMTPRSSAS